MRDPRDRWLAAVVVVVIIAIVLARVGQERSMQQVPFEPKAAEARTAEMPTGDQSRSMPDPKEKFLGSWVYHGTPDDIYLDIRPDGRGKLCDYPLEWHLEGEMLVATVTWGDWHKDRLNPPPTKSRVTGELVGERSIRIRGWSQGTWFDGGGETTFTRPE